MTVQLNWQAEDILRAVHGHCLQEQTWTAHGVSIDSRTVQKGDLFIALKGPTHDGHDHVAAAFGAGAIAALVSKQTAQTPTHAPQILVDDTFKALEDLGRAGRKRTEAKIVAVTGSVGKTTSKEMLRVMLSAVGNTYANQGSLNNHWGVPLSLARLPVDARYGVFELGMNHAGELTSLSQMTQPDVSLITTIEAVHLEFFTSIDAIADAKAEIFLGTKAEGAAVLNHDNPFYARLAAAAKKQGLKKILSFGRDSRCDAQLLDYTPTSQSSTVAADIMGCKVSYQLNVPGEHLAINALGCLLAATALGGDIDACIAALSHYQQPQGRGVQQTIQLKDGTITLIDESYNASPVAVRAAIRVLEQSSGIRKILVLGDMKELGDTSAALHTELADTIKAGKIHKVFTCGEMAKHLFDALPAALQGDWARDSVELASLVAAAVQNGDTITVKGSHSMHMDIIIAAIKELGVTQKDKLAS